MPVRHHYIYLSDIEGMYLSGRYLFLANRNQEIEKLAFRTQEVLETFVKMLRQNSIENLRYNIQVINSESSTIY